MKRVCKNVSALFVALVVLPNAARAHPVGEAHRTIMLASAAARHLDHSAAMAVTIWYPASPGSRETLETIGPPATPYFRVASVAKDAKPAGGKRPVILVSHGFGGSARMIGMARCGVGARRLRGFVGRHPGNSNGDISDVGSIAWWERPRDMIAALDAMQQDRQFDAIIDRTRVGAAGFSMGGVTALALAGARIDPSNYDRFCKGHPDDGVCQKPAEGKDQPDISRAEGARLLGLTGPEAHASEGTALPGLRAALAIAPPAQQLAQDSFARIHIPVVIMAGDRDGIVPVRNHAEPAARAIPGARLIVMPGVAHYTFLATCTDAARGNGGACDYAPQQKTAHRQAIREALALFHRTLGNG